MTAAQQDDAGADWNAGLDVLTAWAAKGRPFSANDCRPQLRQLGFGRYDTGSLFRDAEQQRIIRQVGLERSVDRPTHGKRIARWIAAELRTPLESLIGRETVTVPVVRGQGGRFSDGVQPYDTPLFEVGQ